MHRRHAALRQSFVEQALEASGGDVHAVAACVVTTLLGVLAGVHHNNPEMMARNLERLVAGVVDGLRNGDITVGRS